MELGNGIVVQPQACIPERFAAAELGRYLGRMLGKQIPVRESGRQIPNAIHIRAVRRAAPVRVPVTAADETYVIDVRKDRVLLRGGSPRAALYAVYAFLEELGCRWFAPLFDFYDEIGAEQVPPLAGFAPAPGRRVHTPSFLYREVLIEECRTQTVAAAAALIEWLPKVRRNVFHAPINYQHSGRFLWDEVRAALVPELRKRGLLVKIGGHGYENFLHPDEFFDAHPEWFAFIDGARSRNPHHVFETANPQALRAFAGRVADYVATHPEIDILSLWPPDIVRWSESGEGVAQGSPGRRQALVTHAVLGELRRRGQSTVLEYVTYDQSENYPERFRLSPEVMVTVDFYYQLHTGPVFRPDTMSPGHSLAPLHDWLARHRGPLGYFAYERRYVWQSRPVVTPSLLWTDMRYCHEQGISGWAAGFAEPGDWLSYELQHYLSAKLTEDVHRDVAGVVDDYCRARFGVAAGPVMALAFWTLEKLAVNGLRLHGDALASAAQLGLARARLEALRRLVRRAARAPDPAPGARLWLRRFRVGLRRLDCALEMLDAEASGNPARLEAAVAADLALIRRHRGKGLFVEPGWLNRSVMLWQFGGTSLSAAAQARVRSAALSQLLGNALP